MKWTDVANTALHYLAAAALLGAWIYLVQSGMAAKPGGDGLLVVVQGALVGLGTVKAGQAGAKYFQGKGDSQP